MQALLWLLAVGLATAQESDQPLPSCNQARILYEDNKLYDALGVKQTAADSEIKRNFRKMSVQC